MTSTVHVAYSKYIFFQTKSTRNREGRNRSCHIFPSADVLPVGMGRPALLHHVVQGFAAPAPKAREQNVTASGSTHEGFEDLFLAHYARIAAVLRQRCERSAQGK